jgi:hypothetical protein
MHPLSFPIRLNQSDAAVANLHLILLYLLKRLSGFKQPDSTQVLSPKEQLQLILLVREEQASRLFGPQTLAAIRILQVKHGLSASGEIGERDAEVLNKKVADLGGFALTNEYRVEGLVFQADGTPLAATVKALDKNLREDTLLGDSKTNATGFYEIHFAADRFTKSGKTGPDLFVRVEAAQVNETSAVRNNAGRQEEIDRVVGGTARVVAAPEFQRLNTVLSSRLGTVKLADLKKDDQQDDFGWLAQQTGESESYIRLLSDAHRLAPGGVSPELVFAALYGGLTGTPQDLYAQRKQLPELVARAAQDGLIAPRTSQEINTDLASIRSAAFNFLLKGNDSTPGLESSLEAAGLNVLRQRKFTDLLLDHEGTTTAFWEKIEADNQLKQFAPTLRFELQVAELIGHHQPMAAQIRQLKQNEQIKITRDLARISQADWKSMVQVAGFPAEVPGDSPEEKQQTYMDGLMASVEATYPSEFYTARLLEKQTGATPVRRFLSKNVWERTEDSALKIHAESLDSFLSRTPDAFEGFTSEEQSEVRRSLHKIIRLHRLGGTASDALALDQLGYSSAQGIAFGSSAGFVARHADTLGSENAARIYRKASLVQALTLGVVTEFSSASQVQPRVILQENPAVSSRDANIPSWVDMFGSIDQCLVPDCLTAYGAPAYLTDVFRFLDARKIDGRSGLDVLFERRPDLKHLALSCENTETMLPYIDLVNELLELTIAPPLAGEAVLPYQTGGTTEARIAQPEYIRSAAYEPLKTAVYPWSLPFDVNRETLSQCLKQVDLEQITIQESLWLGKWEKRWEHPALSFEYLGLSPAEAAIIMGNQAESVWECWGYSAETLPDTGTSILWYSTLAQNIQELMRRAGLSYDELLQMLDARYVNPLTTSSAQRQINFTEDISGPACDTATMQLTGLDDIALDRLMRFVRLWRKLGWSVHDTDRAVRVLGNHDIDENCLVQIAQLKRLQNRTKLSIEDLLIWWEQDITSYVRYTPRGPVVIPSWYDKFISGQDAPVPLADAAVKYRRFTISQAMQINQEELEYWIKWTHADPFGTPAEALLFFEQMDHLRQAGFTVYDLRFLLQDSPVGNQYTEIEKRITAETILRSFKAALGEALANAKEFVPNNNPELSAEEKEEKLAQEQKVEHTKRKIFQQTLADLFDLSVKSVQLVLHKVNAPDFTEDPTILEDLAIILSRTGWVARHFNVDDYSLQYSLLNSDIKLVDSLNQDKATITAEVRRTFFEKWVEMARWINLQSAMPGMGRWLTVQDSNGTFVKEAVVDGMSQAWNWKKEEVKDILTAFEAYEVQPSPRHLQRLLQVVALLRKTGLTWEQLQGLDQSQAAINMLRQHYDDTRWLDTLKVINNPLRERRRDAMLRYLLTHPPVTTIKDANDLYMHLLIDVEMSAAQLTSRLKQAMGSTQLFVQRCLLGLEAELIPTLGDPDWEQWKWMKNYRVWEANRKVFLYPENWIEPELRDDKSSFFKELENEILQNEITDANVEQVVRNYLNKLDAVSRLEIMAEYHEKEDANGRPADILHVFGRTSSVPHQYYYRRHLNKTVWTPWEKIEADIEGNHLIPVIWNRRLHLFWPVFTEKQVEANVEMPSPGDTMVKGVMYKEVALAWSEYRNGAWMSKKMSVNKIKPIFGVNDKGEHIVKEGFWLNQDMSQILFTAYDDQAKGVVIHMRITNLTSNNQKIQRHIQLTAQNGLPQNGEGGTIFTPDTSGNPAPVLDPQFSNTKTAYFYFQECGGEADILASYNTHYFEPLGHLAPSSQRLSNDNNSDSGLYLYSDNTKNLRTILKHMPNRSLGSIAFSVQDSEFNPILPFFYQNKKNTFHVGTQKPGGVYLGRRQPRANARFPNKVAAFSEILSRSTFFYKFTPHYHPYSCDFLRRLGAGGFEQLLTLKTQQQRDFNFETTYKPQYVAKPYPVEKVTLDMNGAYSLYNWELFFHIPMMIADRLSKNQRFEEAMRWFHFVFNPLSPTASDADQVSRNWQFRRFAELAESGEAKKRLEAYLNPDDPDYAETQAAIRQWRNNPFKPHLVARWRNSAYMRHVVMRYLDNLIAWGDELFRRDTLESINEATQLYVLAAEILGEKPRLVTPRKAPTVYSFAEIRDSLDGFSIFTQVESNLLEQEEDEAIPVDSTPLGNWSQIFVLSPNDKLLGYWDTVADRLFKIRHSMNISGQVRQLPLFEPPIDPALLVRATAAGLDISTALGEIVFAPAVYRYVVLAAKASELAAEVRGLGATLLSAIEKRDAEGLTMLRSGQEIRLLEAVRDIKVRQINEAKEQVKAIEHSLRTVEIRKNFYDGKLFMNPGEGLALLLGTQSLLLKNGASVHEATAKILAALGDFKFGSPTTVGSQNGPRSAANALKHAADQISTDAAILDNISSLILTTNSYVRRKEDWNLQADLAKAELKQLDRQLIAAQIRLAMAEQDLRNHDRQTENAREADEYMRSKFTNLQLYDWMTSQVSAMYFQAYNMAFRLARQAESAMKLELGLEHNTEHIIKTSYWDSLKKGLLSGDLLYQDIKRLEAAYLERNTRELELTKHISLNQLNPLALLELREKGTCTFSIPEELFDLDFPGHYMRRIKSVSITLPCVAGPYTSINATLRLTKNEYRRKPNLSDPLIPQNVPVSAIATSSAQNDSGLFELNFRDERYLPFEGAGAISTWTLEMMEDKELRHFDYHTIADVVVHLRYTAREGMDKAQVTSALTAKLNSLRISADETGLFRLFSLRHDFPNEWHAWKNKGLPLAIKLEKHHFPYFAQLNNLSVKGIKAYLGTINKVDLVNSPDLPTSFPQEIDTGGWEWNPGDALDNSAEDWLVIVEYQIA